MVMINGVKYACERCVRGHRVTACTHTDQPLLAIKKKGRPSSQCEHCREQRKIKNAHITCVCGRKNRESGDLHDPSCPCHIDGKCTCQKNKKKTPKESDRNNSTTSLGSGSSPSTGAPTPKDNIQATRNPGEISIPIDEYMGPLNTMTNNLHNLLQDKNPNGLLDAFEQDPSVGGAPNQPMTPEGLFPLYPLLGPSYDSLPLQQTNTGSSYSKHLSSTALQHSNSSSSSVNIHPPSSLNSPSSANLHHAGHHSHHHHGYFSPYPTPRRTTSFISLSSNSSINTLSPPRPSLLTMESTDSLNGFQLTNSKTNSTVVDDQQLYHTKTLTDSSMSQVKNEFLQNVNSIGSIPISSSDFVKAESSSNFTRNTDDDIIQSLYKDSTPLNDAEFNGIDRPDEQELKLDDLIDL